MNKLYVLGTGQAVVKHYHNTCFVLSDGEDYFLVDGGGGGDILRCMDRMKIPWERLYHAFLTHGHAEEILGDWFTFFDIHSTKAMQYGFRMDAKEGYHLVFLGDEPFSEKCLPYMEPCDWLLAESFCLYSERHIYNPTQYYHGTVMDACECANRFHAKNLVLWHTEDETTFGIRKDVYTKEAKTFFDGNIYVPDDFDTIELA